MPFFFASFFLRLRGLGFSFSSFSRVEKVLVVAGMGHDALVGPIDKEGEVAFDSLGVILADERVRDCLPMLELGDEEGADGAFLVRELGGGLVEEEGRALDSWMTSCLVNFCHNLGMLIEGES